MRRNLLVCRVALLDGNLLDEATKVNLLFTIEGGWDVGIFQQPLDSSPLPVTRRPDLPLSITENRLFAGHDADTDTVDDACVIVFVIPLLIDFIFHIICGIRATRLLIQCPDETLVGLLPGGSVVLRIKVHDQEMGFCPLRIGVKYVW